MWLIQSFSGGLLSCLVTIWSRWIMFMRNLKLLKR
jgi:hypothetical protein